MPPLYLGTSAFTAAGWVGSFYPAGMKSHDFLGFYAEHFDSVEVDSTFYRTPSAHTVSAWASKTPSGFVFSVKAPQVITHEKILADCDDELSKFLNTMDLLGEKLGPMVFQFPFFNRSLFKTPPRPAARKILPSSGRLVRQLAARKATLPRTESRFEKSF